MCCCFQIENGLIFFLEVVQLFIAHEELLHVYFTESRERMNQSWKKILFYVISNINLFSFMTSQGAYCGKIYGNVRNVWGVSHGFTQNILGQVQSWFSDGIMVFWLANNHFQFFYPGISYGSCKVACNPGRPLNILYIFLHFPSGSQEVLCQRFLKCHTFCLTEA